MAYAALGKAHLDWVESLVPVYMSEDKTSAHDTMSFALRSLSLAVASHADKDGDGTISSLEHAATMWDQAADQLIMAADNQQQRDLAASSQQAFENIILEHLENLVYETSLTQGIVLSGGCALNVKLAHRAREAFPGHKV